MYDSLWALSTMGGNYGPLAARAVLGGGGGGGVGVGPLVPSPPPTSEPSPPGGTLPHQVPVNKITRPYKVVDRRAQALRLRLL